ncbi:hypothetical protein L1987_15362 [Smallanthus sonchifolius]|uniref:Uncharacterized protein n=1 Tax=Smallanthus sonchifolius TaxID=185202 RepID=A0ACB9J6X3_9ASTR|nr:hypothetical protein L1987_15362 [Smallanthus sonchifolius]
MSLAQLMRFISLPILTSYNHGFRSCGDLIHINVHYQLKIWIFENLNKCNSCTLNKYARIIAHAFTSEFNLLAYTEPEWKGDALQYRDIVDFLNRSRISYAISADPIVSRPYLEQFWETAEHDCTVNPNVIRLPWQDMTSPFLRTPLDESCNSEISPLTQQLILTTLWMDIGGSLWDTSV